MNQKLIDIVFEVGMMVKNTDELKKLSNEKLAEWIRKQLSDCGYETVPCGSSWGILKENKLLLLLLVDNQVKGIVTKLPSCPKWWHEVREVMVPMSDWNNYKVNIDTIHKYI